MKKWLLYLLIPVMLLQSNMTVLICASFTYHQQYIEKYLCVQRSMANNSCHGQCFLMQKIKDQQEREQENFKINLHESFALEVTAFDLQHPAIAYPLAIRYGADYADLHPSDYHASVFHPPVV